LLPNNQLAMLADKIHRLRSLGEIDVLITETETNNVVLRLRALVVENLNVPCYGGQTFHLDNGIVDDVTRSSISLHNGKFQIHQQNKYGHLVPHPPPYLTLSGKQDQPQSLLSAQCCRPPVPVLSHQHCPHSPLQANHQHQHHPDYRLVFIRLLHGADLLSCLVTNL
jgi:hypothetical protein